MIKIFIAILLILYTLINSLITMSIEKYKKFNYYDVVREKIIHAFGIIQKMFLPQSSYG